ncbi:hypothetical protein C3R36_02150, partial [Mycobacterium tuberculosis]
MFGVAKRFWIPMVIVIVVAVAAVTVLNRPGMSGDSSSWKGWGHVRWFI